MTSHRSARVLAGTLVTLLAGFAPPVHAQLGSGDGFLFRAPTFRLALSGGYARPRAQSDIFDFVTSELTLGRGDFTAGEIGASAAFRVAPRVEVGLNVSYSGRSADSESRLFEGEDDLPIVQSTSLHRAAIMATGRMSLLSPGRSVGRFAWIPTRVVPFVGGGLGPIWYRLRQDGEFVDGETLDIFEDTFESKGWSLGATGFGGADFALHPRFGMTAEARYLWGKGSLSSDYSGFSKIDLSGYDASIGLYVRF